MGGVDAQTETCDVVMVSPCLWPHGAATGDLEVPSPRMDPGEHPGPAGPTQASDRAGGLGPHHRCHAYSQVDTPMAPTNGLVHVNLLATYVGELQVLRVI